MGFHDDMAWKAVERGESAEVFSRAAQNKANAFWFWLIVAGIVWYFYGWSWALIPCALALLNALQSISATMTSTRLGVIEAARVKEEVE